MIEPEYKKETIVSLMGGVDKGILDWVNLPFEDVVKPKEKADKKWGGSTFDAITTKYINRVVQKDNKSMKLIPNIIDNNRLSLADNFKSLVGKQIIHFPVWPGEITTNEIYIRLALYSDDTLKQWSRSCFDIVKIEYTFGFGDNVDQYYTTNRYTAIDESGKFVNFFKTADPIVGNVPFTIDLGEYKVNGFQNDSTKAFESIRLEKDKRNIIISLVSFERRCLNDQTGIVKSTKFISKIEKGIWDNISALAYTSVSATIYIEYKVENIINEFPKSFHDFFGLTKIQITNLSNFYTFINYVPTKLDDDLLNGAKLWVEADQYNRIRINSSLTVINSYWNSCKAFVKQICKVALTGSKLSNKTPSFDTALVVIASFIKASIKFLKKWSTVGSFEPEDKWVKSKIKLGFVDDMYAFKVGMTKIAKYVTETLNALPNDHVKHLTLVMELLPHFAAIGINSNIVPELLDHAKVQFVVYTNFFNAMIAWYKKTSDEKNLTATKLKEGRIERMNKIKEKLKIFLKQLGTKQYLTEKNVIKALEDIVLVGGISEEDKQNIVRQALIEIMNNAGLAVPLDVRSQDLLDYMNLSLGKIREDAKTMGTNVSTNMDTVYGGGDIEYKVVTGGRPEDEVIDEEMVIGSENKIKEIWEPLADIDKDFTPDELTAVDSMIKVYKGKLGGLIPKTGKMAGHMIYVLKKVYGDDAINASIKNGILPTLFKYMVLKLRDIRDMRFPERVEKDFILNFTGEMEDLVDLYKSLEPQKKKKGKITQEI